MSEAVAECDDAAAVALSMARLGVLDAAEARLSALRQRQRAMVDTLLGQLRTQRGELRGALNAVVPGLDVPPPGAALACALGAAAQASAAGPSPTRAQALREQGAQATGWRGAAEWARSQLPGVAMGAVGALRGFAA
jgi:hypothetical protein